MKKILSAFMLIAAVALYSFKGDKIKGNGNVTSQERQTGSFTKIATAGSIDIKIIQGTSEGVTVSTDENLQSSIITEVKNNTLSIHVKEDTDIEATKLIVMVNCRNLNTVNAGGSGDISTENILKTDNLEISQGGSGDFKFDVDVNKLTINMAGSGDFDLRGKAATLDVNSAGSGDVHAQKLKTGDVSISMAGSGDVILANGSRPHVSSVGSGEVHYE